MARSIWLEIYGRPVQGSLGAQVSPKRCLDELESLFHRLESRSAVRMAAREEPSWEAFSRDFEERLRQVELDCSATEAWPGEVTAAIGTISDGLHDLRTHYARCGEAGETTRTGLVQGFGAARAALKR